MYARKGELDRAILDYGQAIQLKPDYYEVISSRGNLYFLKQDYDRAIQDYDQAIRLKPNDVFTHKYRGITYFDKGQFQAALGDYEKLRQLEPANLDYVIWVYLAQSRAGQNGRDALARHAAGLDLKPWPGPVVALYLGTLMPQALLDAAKNPDAKTQQGQTAAAYFYLGEQLLFKGKKEEAARMFRATLDAGIVTISEYYSARAELTRLGY